MHSVAKKLILFVCTFIGFSKFVSLLDKMKAKLDTDRDHENVKNLRNMLNTKEFQSAIKVGYLLFQSTVTTSTAHCYKDIVIFAWIYWLILDTVRYVCLNLLINFKYNTFCKIIQCILEFETVPYCENKGRMVFGGQ